MKRELARGLIARLFPGHIDNTFAGRRLALYAFYPVTALILWRSLHHLIAADGGAQSIATMPLDTYPSGAAQNIIAIFAQWGLSQLLLGLVCLAACIRYRAMIPLMWLLLVLEAAGRQIAGTAKPIATLHTAPGAAGNLPMLILALVMLLVSLTPRSVPGRSAGKSGYPIMTGTNPDIEHEPADGWFPALLATALILILINVIWDAVASPSGLDLAELVHAIIGELSIAVFIGWVISVGIERASRRRDAREAEGRRQVIAENVVRGVFGVQYPTSYVQAVIDAHLLPKVVRLSYQAAFTIRPLTKAEEKSLEVLPGRLVAFSATRSFKFKNVSSRAIEFPVRATIPLRLSPKLRAFAKMRAVSFDGVPLTEDKITKGILTSSEIEDHRAYRWMRRIQPGAELSVVFDSIMIKELSDTELWWNANPTLEGANFSANVPVGMHFGLQAISSQELTTQYVSAGDGTGTWKIDGPVLSNESVVFWWRTPADDGEPEVGGTGTTALPGR